MRLLNLRQEDMTVAEYEVKFSELARFVPEYVNTEAKKAKILRQGLKPWIQSQVALLEIRTYATIVQKAMIVEGEREATKRESEGKKTNFEDSKQDQGSSKFRGKFGRNSGCQNLKFQKFKPGNGNQKNYFQKKGHYSAECPNGAEKPEMTYFMCGKVGHMARNYKEPVQKANVLRIAGPPPSSAPTPQPRARTFNMTMKDAVQNAVVVAGALVINSVEFKVLMDSGATRSFIAESVIGSLKCVAYPLEPNLIIEVANQERVTTNRICPSCDIVIEDWHYSADLIPFKLGKFNVILGIDGLSNHDMQIECKRKESEIEVQGWC
ncbi:uncharacterized protein LOC141714475 [Apium graveolens]|uniref:uncharacterized protein LOC141714475 n=1 Tax=Apium graveolens TaxID=4045 RepID=UPI003D78F3E3